VTTVLIVVGLALVVLLPGPIWSLRYSRGLDAGFEVSLIVFVAVVIVLVAWFVSELEIR
jgi:energy-converting hydrogenase Eha subunit F